MRGAVISGAGHHRHVFCCSLDPTMVFDRFLGWAGAMLLVVAFAGACGSGSNPKSIRSFRNRLRQRRPSARRMLPTVGSRLVLPTLATCAGVAGAAATAAAAERPRIPVRITVDAPAACSDTDAFFAQLHTRSALPREAASGEEARSIHVVLRPDEDQVLGTLTVREVDGEEGSRTLRGPDCRSVAEGLALVAVVILDPQAVLATNPAPSLPRAPERSRPAQAPPNRSLPDASGQGRDGSPLRLSAGAGLEVALGLGPGTQIVPRVFLDIELPGVLERVSGRLSAGRGFGQSVVTDVGTGDLTLTDVRAEACFAVWARPRFELPGCGLVEDVVLSGQGTHTHNAQDASRVSADLGLAARPTWIVYDRIVLGVLVGAALPITHYRFYFAPDTTAYRIAPWAGFGEVSVGARFW
jgi:hypothetical protein